MATQKKNTFQFEQSLNQLNALVEKMELGELSLEQSLAHFEQGIQLIRDCQKALNEANQKIEILTQKHGQNTIEPYEAN